MSLRTLTPPLSNEDRGEGKGGWGDGGGRLGNYFHLVDGEWSLCICHRRAVTVDYPPSTLMSSRITLSSKDNTSSTQTCSKNKEHAFRYFFQTAGKVR